MAVLILGPAGPGAQPQDQQTLDICVERIICWAEMKSIFPVCAIIFSLACFAGTGCESDSTESMVTITPDSVVVRRGDAVEFTASGGYEYTWSLETEDADTESYGYLSTRTGSKTVYTCLEEPESGTVTRVLKVVSAIEGAGSTNSNPDAWTGRAYITHQ